MTRRGGLPSNLGASGGKEEDTEGNQLELPSQSAKVARSAFLRAVMSGDLDTVRSMIDSGQFEHNLVWELCRDHFDASPILIAMSAKDEKMALYLLALPGSEDFDFNRKGRHSKRTLLHVAALQGLASVVQYLVSNLHADINVIDVEGDRPICLAIQGNDGSGGHKEVVRFLLQQHSQQDGRTIDDLLENLCKEAPLLFYAFATPHRGQSTTIMTQIDMASFMIDELGACLHTTVKGTGNNKNAQVNLLDMASTRVDIDAVRWLLVDRSFPVDLSVFNFAVASKEKSEEERLEVVRLLVEHGADITHKHPSGRAWYEFAACCGNKLISDYLKSLTPSDTTHNASPIEQEQQEQQQKQQRLELLFFSSRDSSRDYTILSALDKVKGDFEKIKRLIEQTRVHPAVLWEWTPDNPFHHSPLFTAILEAHEDVALYLLSLPGQEKYDINVCDPNSISILHVAAAEGFASVVKKLVLTRNANINLGDANGHKAICTAISNVQTTGGGSERGYTEVVRFLLEQHCLQDGRSRQDVLENICCTGDPLLFHIFTRSRGTIRINTRFAMAAFLMDELGADPYCTSEKYLDGPFKMNLLQAATSYYGDIDAVRWLLTDRNFPVDLQTSDSFRGTALHLTASAEQKSEETQLAIVRLLVEVGGANVLLKNSLDLTPHAYAVKNGLSLVSTYLAKQERRIKMMSNRRKLQGAGTKPISQEAIDAAAAAEASLLADLEAEATTGAKAAAATAQPKSGSKNKKRKNKQKQRGSKEETGAGAKAAAGGSARYDDEKEGSDAASAQALPPDASVLAAAMGALDMDDGDEQGAKEEEDEQGQEEEEKEREEGKAAEGNKKEDDYTLDDFLLDEAPDCCRCPISHTLLTEPVFAMDSMVYNKSALEGWIETCKSKGKPFSSPMTQVEMEPTFFPNHHARAMVSDYIDAKTKEWYETGGGGEMKG